MTNDGTLYAPAGSILTASYTDPNSSSYNSSATATIQPAPGVPGVVMNKTILSPSGGRVIAGQSVTFNLQAVNVGSTTLPNLSINDSFPSAQLSYSAASLAPNTVATGLLTWTNLGAFAPGQSTNITVTFTASATGVVTNFATANGVSITNNSSVSLQVNNPALTVTKILLSPTNTPVAVGSNVVFRITVQNAGNTVVNYLPLEDTFSGAYYQFVSATIAPNGSGAGSLIWTNLASPTALATNAIITNDITMQVVGQGNPAYNTATVDYATDVFSNAVPTASSTIGVNTASASINGHVYNDINQSGVFTNGDTGLYGVTLQLFTDPNGDGNPADGTLVQITTTDANGYYELLNLNTGHYVVVETDLPGYASSVPANNRLSINVTNLAAFTNANFFQYVPAPAVYSTISGTVWYDTNGNGTNDVGETGLANFEIDLVQDVNSNGVADSGEPVTASVTTAANGNYSFAGITPGHYVIRQTLPYGYYTTGDSQGRTDNQISFASTNGIVSTNNSFFDRLLPIAVNDTNSALYFVPVTIYPLTNDINPNNDTLTISSATSSNGIAVINPGFTNITFTPTNTGTAIIAYTISDNHGGTSSAIISVNVTALADVAIGKTGSASVFAASNLVYTISVTNFGPSPANFVVVTDTLPAGVTFVSASGNGANNSGVVSWTLGTLANGQVSNVTVTVTAPASGSLTNVATVSSPTGDPNSTNNVTLPVITTVTAVADIGIGKSASAVVSASSNLVYTISVTNFGPSSASSVVVTDTLPAGVSFVSASGSGLNNSGVVSWSLGTLANGQVSNVTVTVTAPASGSLTNVATVSSPTGDPNSTNNVTPPVITTVTAVADIGIGKSASAVVSASSNLVYTISVTNFGPSSASSVVVTDTLPAGVSFVSASGGGANNSGVVSWSLGTLANGQVSNVTVTVTAPASGSLTNVATVSSPTSDPNSTNNVTPPVITTVTAVADIGIGKSASAVVSASSNLVYTISVTNFGPSSASSVVVTDTLPAGVSFVSASGGGANNSGVVSWTLGTLANGQVSNVTVTVTAPASGSLTNVATVSSPTGDPNSTNNVTPPVITTVTAVADIGIGKSALASVSAASNLVYTISVTNFGPSSASSVVVTDTLPATVTFVSASGNGINNSGVVSWTLGTLANGQVSNVTVTVTAPASGSLTNVATVSSPTGDPNSTNNVTPPVITTVTAVADIGIGKLASAVVSASSNLVYTISVTNFGPSSASSVVVTDTLPANVTFVSASGSGLNNSGVVSWTLGTLANGQVSNVTVTVTAPASGSLTNVATVSSPTGDPNSTNNVTPPVITTVTAVADIGIGKSASASVSASSNLVYTISVTNFGPSSASSVVVTDTLPAGVSFVSASGGGLNNSGVASWSLGTLANGQVSNVTVTVTAPASGSLTNVATVSSPTGDPNSTNNVTPPVITTVTAVADIGIGKLASASVSASSNLVYTISVTNFGPSSASSVTVTDTLPAGVTFVSASGGGVNNSGVASWSLGTLANGQVSNVTVTVTAPASGSLTNVATVSSPTGDPNSTNNVTPPVITTVTAVADIGIGKSALASVSASSNLVYTISVTNFGPSSASSVTVTDTLPAGVTFVSASGNGINNSGVVSWSLGTLANGQVSNVTVTVTAPASGSLTNVATVSSPTGDPNSTNNVTPPVITTVTAVADIGIGKLASAVVSASSNLVYTISVTNFGPSSASSVVVTDTLPANVTFVSASGGGVNNGGVVSWSLGTLANGQVSNVTVTVTAPASGTLTNTASVSSPTGDPNSTNNVTPPVITTVTAVADIGIGKSALASVSASSNLVYTISVTNFGPSSASSVVVTDTLPAGVSFVSASGGGLNNGGVVNWTLGTLANGQVSNVTVTVTAPASGTLTNTASVSSPTGDPNSTNNITPPVITTVTAVADIGIGKLASAVVSASSNLVYTISVTNFGPSSASSVVVTDTLPAGVSFVSASGGGTNNSGVVSWSLGTLANGQVSNVTVTVTAPASGSLTNVASVSSPTGDPNSTNNVTPPVITTVTAVADIGIGKSASAVVSASSNLVYTISVTNFGPSSASSVVVTDTLPATVTFVSASGNGINNSGVVSWSLGTLANGQVSNVTVTVTAPASGSLTNVATVSSPTGDPNSTNNVTPPVITTVTAVADIGIGKLASAVVSASSNLVYTISVTNFGPSSASSVVVTDTLPATVTFVSASGNGINNSGVVSWSLGTLAIGQVSNVTVTVTAPASGSLTNVATVSSPTGDPNSTNNVTLPVITTVTAVADIGIGKSASASVSASSNLVYTISVTNFGPSSASSVVVTDTLPANVTFVSASGSGLNNSGVVSWSLGTLANGQVSNVTVTVTAPASGTLTNTASVSSPTGDPNSTNNVTPPVITTVTAVADIGIGKSASAVVSASSNLVYTISVTNFGPSSASSVVVTDTLPANVTFVSASGGGVNNGGVVSWSLGTLANGQVSNVTVTVTAPASGTLTNTASVSSPTGDPNSTNNVTPPVITTVTAVADIGIGKSASASVSASSNLVYTISVTNFGPSSASSVVVTDTLPANVTFVSASGSGLNNSGVVSWSLGTLANGQVSNVTVTVTAPASGTLTNTASVSSPTGDPNSTNNVTPPVITTVTAVADIGIGKSASAVVSASSNLVYTISVTNFGPSSASSVVVTDTLPANVTFVSASGGGVNNGGVVSWTLGTLANGRVSNVTVTVTAPASGSLTNVATVSSPTGDPNSTNNVTPPVITTVTNSALPQADIAVFKTGPTSGIAGSNLTYTVTVNNSGPSTATNVVVSDLLPAGFTFVSATPSSTVSNNLVSWPAISLAKNAVSNFTVTAVSAAGGNFTNIAFATSDTLDPNPTNNNGTLTNAQVRTTVAPLADVAVFKTGSTNVNAGGAVVYTITATNMGPSTASNVVVRDNLPAGVTFQSASGSYTLSNTVVTWPGVTLAKGMSVDFTLTMTAPASGSFVNVASGASDTPDPNMTNNNGSAAGSRVSTLVTPVADLIVLLSGSTNVIVGNSLVYTIVVTNGGPSTASNIVVQDNLPASLAFSSTSAGGSFSNNVITWPTIPALTNGGSTNFTITVTAPNVGVFTNIASALSSTLDLNLTNNNGTSPASQVQTAVMPAQFMFGISGAPVFNPQTGLFEEQVTVTNIGSTTVAGVRLLIGGLPSSVTLYDATGTNNGTPYVQYNFPLNPGNTVSFALEFYNPSRLPFTNTLTAIAILPANSGSPGTNGVFISGIFLDTRIAGDPRIVIEFLTTPGNTYTIIYSDNNLFAWQVATPSITANATTTQWYDDGPPKTDSKPFSITNRFYRVIAAP